jgi:hypothetical protein
MQPLASEDGEYFVYNFFVMLLSFESGYIKDVKTVQEQEGSTEDIFIHRTNLRGGYKTENTNTKHTYKKCKSYQKICKSLTIISLWCSIHFLTCCLVKDAQ